MTAHRSLAALLCAAASLSAQAHQERVDDRAGAAPAAAGGPAAPAAGPTVRRGPFVHTQVNIDARGNDIRGDAANEPTLAIDPRDPKKITVGWRQFDTISSNFRKNGYAWSADGGTSWTFPGAIEPSLFNSDPVLDYTTTGDLLYLSYPSGRTLKVFRSTDSGKTWGSALPITGGDKAWMIVDQGARSRGKDFVHVLWQVVHGPNTYMRSVDGGRSFAGPYAVPSWPTFGTLAVDGGGTLYSFGLVRQNWSSFVLAISANASDRTQTPTWVTRSVNMGGRMQYRGTPNPGGLMGQAEVLTDPARPGHVYLMCSIDPPTGDPLDIHFVRSTDGGKTFSAPVRVNDDSTTNGAWQWLGAMGVAPDGRIDIVWFDTRATGSARLSELFYAWSHDGGVTWSQNVPVSPKFDSLIGHPNQNKIGDYVQVRSDGAAAHVAWPGTFTGGQDVYYTRLGDCNGNNVHDGLDIRSGDSLDANRNAIPDECETCQPDLGNGTRLALSLCGDDLTLAGSRASLKLTGGAPHAPVALALSLGRFTPPIRLPGGGGLVPDITAPGSFVFGGYSTDARGRVGATWSGGTRGVTTVYLQAAMLQSATTLDMSNALGARIGL